MMASAHPSISSLHASLWYLLLRTIWIMLKAWRWQPCKLQTTRFVQVSRTTKSPFFVVFFLCFVVLFFFSPKIKFLAWKKGMLKIKIHLNYTSKIWFHWGMHSSMLLLSLLVLLISWMQVAGIIIGTSLFTETM